MKIIKFNFADTKKGLKQKLLLIAELINKGSSSWLIRETVINIIKEVPEFDFFNEALEVFEWVKSNIRYVRDIESIELLHDADKVIEFGAGDCDDFVILLGAMLKSIGFPIRLVLLSEDNEKSWTHIYLQIYDQKKWLSLDAAMKLQFNEELPGRKKYFLIQEKN